MKEGETFCQVYPGGMSASEISELFPNEKLAKKWRLVLEITRVYRIF